MIQIFIKDLSCNKYHTFFCDSMDVKLSELKKYIYKKTKLPSTWQRYVYGSKPIYNNSSTLKEFNMQNESTIYMFLRFHGVGCECDWCPNQGILLRSGKRLK